MPRMSPAEVGTFVERPDLELVPGLPQPVQSARRAVTTLRTVRFRVDDRGGGPGCPGRLMGRLLDAASPGTID